MAGQIIPAAIAPQTSLPPAEVAKLHKAATAFEAMALGEMLKPMFDTVDLSKTGFGGGEAEATWKPMLISEMAKKIAAGGGVGLAAPVFKEMLRLQEGKKSNGGTPAS